jgi:6-phosphogluconate dehydrogenase
MVGLGVMGRNLVLNMADHGFSVGGYDRDLAKVEALRQESKALPVRGATEIPEFIALLRQPRAIMILVPAGGPVDAVIQDLMPHLSPGDLIIDGGNSHFTDSDVRSRNLAATGIQFLGVGISGGEEGARHGPSIMPGGPREAYERVRPLFEAVAAKAGGEPCVTYLGSGSAGHFVKMVHNGIEYALMQLIAETYDLMKRGLGLKDDELHAVYSAWNKQELGSYLVEITAHIFSKVDDKTGLRLVDEILAIAEQNGTGMWTSQSAMELQTPAPTIDLAVVMRDLSVLAKEREQGGTLYRQLDGMAALPFAGAREDFLVQLRGALYASMILTYAQGMAVLGAASKKYVFHLDLEAVARIWRGGCIIRAALLDDIVSAFHRKNDLPNLLLDRDLSTKILTHQKSLRQMVRHAAALGIPAPGLMVSLSYFDAYRSPESPANLIQAQRDYFGSHTYARVDAEGHFHTHWETPRTPA